MKKIILFLAIGVVVFGVIYMGNVFAEPNSYNNKTFDLKCRISKQIEQDIEDIWGIEKVYTADYKYHFIVEKGRLFCWGYLLPKIYKVLNEYNCCAVIRETETHSSKIKDLNSETSFDNYCD